MLQRVNGRLVYVVDFDTMPEMPITGSNLIERVYARVLTHAIQNGVITKPGKYGIYLSSGYAITKKYDIYKIVE